jgi:hypothetical protein
LGASDRPEEDNNKKRMEENKLKNVKFDLFLFWNLESFENWMERTLLSQTAVLTLLKTKLHFYRTDDATAHPSYGQQINGDWKEISRFDSWPVLATGRLGSRLIQLRKSPQQDLVDHEKEIQLIERSWKALMSSIIVFNQLKIPRLWKHDHCSRKSRIWRCVGSCLRSRS